MIEWLIQNKVIVQNALKSGISVTDSDIYTQAKNQFDIINNVNKYFNEMALQTYGINEDTYIRNVLMPIMKEYDIIAIFQLQYLSKNNVNSNDLARTQGDGSSVLTSPRKYAIILARCELRTQRANARKRST